MAESLGLLNNGVIGQVTAEVGERARGQEAFGLAHRSKMGIAGAPRLRGVGRGVAALMTLETPIGKRRVPPARGAGEKQIEVEERRGVQSLSWPRWSRRPGRDFRSASLDRSPRRASSTGLE